MHTSKLLGAAAGVAALLAQGTANAGVYGFSFAGSGLSGSGEMVTSGGASPYPVIDVTGTASDESYLSTAPTAITGVSGFLGADNLLYSPGQPSYLDPSGISFSTADGNEYWIGGGAEGYHIASFGTLYVADYPGPLPVGFSVAPVPESSTWTMIAMGIMSLGFAGRRAGSAEAITPAP